MATVDTVHNGKAAQTRSAASDGAPAAIAVHADRQLRLPF